MRRLLLVCVALLAGQRASAQQTPPSFLDIGGGYTFLQLQQPGQASMRGNLGAFQASYCYQPIWQFYGGLTFRLHDGSVSSDGRTQHIFDVDGQERVGYTFGEQNRQWVISLFTGLGYRYINQQETWFGITFNRSNRTFYIPVGFALEGAASARVRLGLMAEWRPQISSTLAISSRQGHRWVRHNTQSNILIEAPLTIALLPSYRMYLVVKPFLDFWQQGQTTAPTRIGAPTPEQTYLFAGIVVNLGCCF